MRSIFYFCERNFLQNYLTTRECSIRDKISGEEAVKELASPFQSDTTPILQTVGDKGIIPITGLLTKNGPDRWDIFFGMGGTGYVRIIEALQMAVDSPLVKEIVLKMDTPGGAASGVDEVFQAIVEANKKKKVIAENHGLIASAGLYIASAASKIVSMTPGTETGSLGVVVAGFNDKELLKQLGLERVVIISENAPDKWPELGTEKGNQIILEEINDVEKVFIDRVAQGRKLSSEVVKKTFGRGAVLIAEKAQAVGMIDEIIFEKSTNSSILEEQQETNDMDLQSLIKENPQIEKEIKSLTDKAFSAGQEAEKKIFKTRAAKIAEYLKPESKYPATITGAAVKVLTGETAFETLESAVLTYDAVIEANSLEAAGNESEPDTPPETNQLSKDGQIKNTQDMTNSIDHLKKLKGIA